MLVKFSITDAFALAVAEISSVDDMHKIYCICEIQTHWY